MNFLEFLEISEGSKKKVILGISGIFRSQQIEYQPLTKM
jgi:hypothetical protein